MLRRALDFDGRVRFTPHRVEHGEAFLEEACDEGWEGLIAKRADAPYRHGRSRDWRKLECVRRQELVIGGYTGPKGSRVGFGALLVDYYEDGALPYAGKVGTGSAPSWSASSASPSGPRTTSSATRASSGCASTRTRRTWSARSRRPRRRELDRGARVRYRWQMSLTRTSQRSLALLLSAVGCLACGGGASEASTTPTA
ncbi:MAG TPA: hypothetical protein RMH99_32930, partial [Sandaracinaceae bacterium LLY-WYZ-13_1]|nr:hypothetical protein [Sandaracinaceae bacterium LLY-WYZ-13_1]